MGREYYATQGELVVGMRAEDWAARLQTVLGQAVHAKDGVQARVRRDRKECHQ